MSEDKEETMSEEEKRILREAEVMADLEKWKIYQAAREGRRDREAYKRLQNVFSVLTAIVLGAIAFFSIFFYADFFLPSNNSAEPIPTQIAEMQAEISVLHQKLNAFTQTITSTRIISIDASTLNLMTVTSEVAFLDDRLAALEQAILDNPAKALESTLLLRDMEDMQDDYRTELENIRGEIQRIFGLAQWFLTAIVTICLAVVGMAVNNFLRRT